MSQTYSCNSAGGVYACNCIGPQGDEPLCPCAMRGVKVMDGRFVIDLGPVPKKSEWHGARLDGFNVKCRHGNSPSYKCPQCEGELEYEE